ncbi:MAG: autotransporter outer membrane beta-barrel domain-containing protein [Deltaproteobacteria bacterium]|nr:autotransporter outer membrane beta-barrel domain-containing protein [Deltaproteobacteria bacterium]
MFIDEEIANFETINKEGTGTLWLNDATVTGAITDAFNHKEGTLHFGDNSLPGDYTQSPGATLLVNVNKVGAQDLLTVGDAADITDGILLLRTQGGEIWDSTYNEWHRWTEENATAYGSQTIITAATSRTGEFVEVKAKELLYTAGVDYSDPNQVNLNIGRALTVNELQNKSSIAPTTNQTAIGSWLENGINLNINRPLISALMNLSEEGADAVKQAINTLSPEPISGSAVAGRINTTMQTANVSQRLGIYHKTGGEAKMAGLASDYFSIMYANPAQKELSGSLWIKTSYLTSEADPDDKFKFDLDTHGVTIGADTPFENLILGASGGYSKSNVEYNTVVSESDIQTLNLNLYGSYKAKNYFIDTVLFYSNHSSDTEREIEVGTLKETAKSDYDANEYGVYLNFGYPFVLNNGWTITPNASLQYSKYEQDAFTEKSALNAGLIVSGTDTDSIASGLGFSVEKVIAGSVWKIIPKLSVLWRHEFADIADTIEANFVGYENDLGTFKIEGYDQGADTFATQIGLTVYNGANTELFLNYDLGVKEDFITNSVTAGLKFYF